MRYHQIAKPRWKDFFDQISRELQGQALELEMVGLDIGDQIEEPWAPLNDVSYRPAVDTIFLRLRPFSYEIHQPREIVVEERELEIRSISVKDGKGHLQIMNFRRPLRLPEPH